jgi:hypothetical protein
MECVADRSVSGRHLPGEDNLIAALKAGYLDALLHTLLRRQRWLPLTAA